MNFRQPNTSKQRRGFPFISLTSLTFMVLMLSVTFSWHSSSASRKTKSKRYANIKEQVEGSHHRLLASNNDPLDITDDATRSATCKQYLLNFLNGTTDLKDECDAFKTAFNAADCQQQDNAIVLTSTVFDKKGNASTDDDVLIDDFFENWECCDSIERMYMRNCEEEPGEYHSVRLLAIMLVMLVCTMLKAMLKQANVGWLPDACAFILVGSVLGGVLRLFDSTFVGSRLSFDNDLFLQIMLPPIIFQAALSIDKRAFRRDLFPILAFAGLGTAFSAIAIGWITHKVSQWGNQGHLPLLDSLVFGALIASIDPVATLSILAGVGVSQTDTMYTLIFGESLLNDGVAIVLFDTLKDHLGGNSGAELDESAYHEMANNFAAVLFGSIIVGLTVGCCCTLYFYHLRGQQTAVTEVAVFFCWALVPYYIAEAFGWSGIIAIMVMGFFMDYFVVGGFESGQRSWLDYMAIRGQTEDGFGGRPQLDNWTEIQISLGKAFGGGGHILPESRHHVGFVAHVIANLMETAIFAYLGLFLFSDNEWNLRLNLTAILSCVSSRAIMVVALSFLINAAVFFDLETRILACFQGIRNQNHADNHEGIGSHAQVYLDRRTQLILLLSGVRGAVSFALVENIPVWDAVTKVGSQYKAELKAMTSTSIVFTLFVFGALTYISVKQGGLSIDDSGGSTLVHRLLSEPMNSDDDSRLPDAESFSHSLSLEIDHPTNGGVSTLGSGQALSAQSTEPYRAPTNQWHE